MIVKDGNLTDLKPNSEFSFSDLVDIPNLQGLLTHFAEFAGCALAVLDVEGTILASAGWQKICSNFHRANPETRCYCAESDGLIREHLKTNNAIAYKCKNGLWDVAFPIVIEEKHVANIFFGQFFYDDELIDLSFFAQQARNYGFDKDAYLNAVKEVTLLPRKKVETLKLLIAGLAKMLAKAGYDNLLLKKEKIAELKSVNKQLSESELKFRKLFESAGVGVAEVEASTGKFLRLNKKYAEILGYEVDEILEKTYKQFTHPDDLKGNLEQHKLLLQKKIREFSSEKRYIRKDGSIIWVLLTSSFLDECDDGNRNLITIAHDISERKNAEAQLSESELKFKKLFEQAGVGVVQVDAGLGHFLKINKKFTELLGYSVEELLQMNFLDLTHPDDLDESRRQISLLIKREIAEFSLEKRYIRKDGTILWAILTVSSFIDADREKKNGIAIIQDISERKKSEQQLIESESKFRKLFELSGVGAAQVDVRTGMFIKVNRKLAEMLGYTIPEFLQLTFRDITYSEDLVLSVNNQAKILKKEISEFSVEKRYRRKDGSVFWGLLTASSMDETADGKQFQIALVQDISERKKAELDLIESEKKFKNIFYQLPNALALFDIESNLLDCNPACLEMFGIANINDILGFNLWNDPNLGDQQKNEIREGKEVRFELKFDFEKIKKLGLYQTSKSGIYFFSCLATPIRIIGNDKMGILFHMVDISERKRAERILSEENHRFHTTMDAIDSVVYVADFENHEILFINKYLKDLFGDIRGKKCYSALQGKAEPCEFCTNHLLMDANGNANPTHIWEFQNLVTKRWYQCHDQAIQWTDGKYVRFEIANDITENMENVMKLKENAIQLQELNQTKDKFFSIISHDLKNPFAVIKSSSELLSRYLDKEDLAKSRAKANMISSASNRGYALLENLLVWAKSQTGGIKFEPRKIIFRETVSNIIGEVEAHAVGKNISIKNEIPDDLILEADENLLSVVFRNLITNAIKFTNAGGLIYITAKIGDGNIEVAVIDNGIGIPKEHQYKLFRLDANFSRVGTANEASTSLGLILCKEFIEKHQGRIWVESEENKGSEFRFTLPHVQ